MLGSKRGGGVIEGSDLRRGRQWRGTLRGEARVGVLDWVQAGIGDLGEHQISRWVGGVMYDRG
eukprot:767805-Hanusia_phi.AAC.1